MTAEERANRVLMNTKGYDLALGIMTEIHQAEVVAAKVAREELLQMPTDGVEAIKAYVKSGRPLTGWTKAIVVYARRKAFEDVLALFPNDPAFLTPDDDYVIDKIRGLMELTSE